jgi:hypothetical protein
MSNNTVKLSIYKEETDEEGTFDAEIEVEFPAKWEICQRCEGDGHHSNPSIDGNGITSSEWAEWDDEEKDTYMSGGYDIPCEAKCSGGKALVVDTENLNDEQKKDYELYCEQEEQRAQSRAEDARIRRMESGGWDY